MDSISTDHTNESHVVRCEFCEITLKSDIDVAKHLHSPAHACIKGQFIAHRDPKDKVVEKQIPKNFSQMLQLIKVRDKHDLDRMKSFFSIKDEASARVAEKMAQQLLYETIEFDAKGTSLGKLFKRKENDSVSRDDSQADFNIAESRKEKIMKEQAAKRRAEEEARRRAELERRAEEERQAEEARKQAELNRKQAEEQRVRIKIEKDLEIAKQKEEEEAKKKQKEEEEAKKKQKVAPKQPTPSMDFDRHKFEFAKIVVKTEPKDDNES